MSIPSPHFIPSFLAVALAAAVSGCGGGSSGSGLHGIGIAAPAPAPASAPIVVTDEECEALRTMQIPHVALTQVTATAGGAFVAPDTTTAADTPPFCRVSGISRPTGDSEIKFEVWMPLSGWNGKLNGTGNGGYGRGLSTPAATMLPALRRGYAVTGTDMGHPATTGYDASWAYGHPEKLADWAYRANHETAVVAKLLIDALYGKQPERAYFTGCSDGGHEALMEAQRYPEDYDGIIGGAPANNFSGQSIAHIWQAQLMLQSGLTAQKLPMIADAVVAACDANDGVVDKLIANPRTCTFDPGVLACSAGVDSPSCLTPSQVDAVRKIYSGPVNPRTGASIYPGLEPGSEALWSAQIATGSVGGIGRDFFRYFVYGDPNWTIDGFDFDKDVAAATTAALLVDSTNPDLDAFRDRGGKFIMWHGLADQTIYPRNSANYFESVARRLAGGMTEAQGFIRLFFVPGMPHCGRGPGVDSFDALTALENWVESGTSPDRIVGTHTGATNGPNVMVSADGASFTRPLCPYPQVPQYKGQGSTDSADSFVCVAPK